jgi:sulfopyruvate decarboxylase alpha subunit
MVEKKSSRRHWSHDVHKLFKRIGIQQVAYVPDGGLAKLIKCCQTDQSMRTVVLTTEEEGVAQMAGAWLGGQRGVLLTQSGGVGNCINMLSMMQECRIPLLSLVSMRGEWGETFPWQVPMGQSTIPALEAAKVIVHRVDEPGEIFEAVNAAAKLAFDANRAVSVIISQRISNSGSRG